MSTEPENGWGLFGPETGWIRAAPIGKISAATFTHFHGGGRPIRADLHTLRVCGLSEGAALAAEREIEAAHKEAEAIRRAALEAYTARVRSTVAATGGRVSREPA